MHTFNINAGLTRGDRSVSAAYYKLADGYWTFYAEDGAPLLTTAANGVFTIERAEG